MKYYIIAGEASGDLHASNLMKALQAKDAQAQFRFFGGDLMAAVGGTLVKHYRELAYMGFVQVILHARTILRNMRQCKDDIVRWQPNVVILVDYPGFNLTIAKYVRQHTSIPVYYYISPKIWAWKEYRIKSIRANVNEMFSILPFEVPFYQKHHYPIHYVGNPCVDAVSLFRNNYHESRDEFCQRHALDERPIVAILAGSRRQEIKDNLPIMLRVAARYPDFQWVIAGAPGIESSYYETFTAQCSGVSLVFDETYALLTHAYAGMVTSGTATLETALFRLPQVVCYYITCGHIVSQLRKWVLKVPYISLVNLIAGREVVRELVAHQMCEELLYKEMDALLNDMDYRAAMDRSYDEVLRLLGPEGASIQAADAMVTLLENKYGTQGK